MDVARVNTAHGTVTDHVRRIAQVRGIAKQLDVPIALLVDLPGPKFRVGTLDRGFLDLHRGEEVLLGPVSDQPLAIPLTQPWLVRELGVDESVYVADGLVKLRVKRVAGGQALCDVVVGGTIRSGAGINLPESTLSVEIPTAEDLRLLGFAASQGAEWLGVSFVRAGHELQRIRHVLPTGYRPLLIAKIEKRQALNDLEAILEAADGLMVARGDLGVETDLAEIPLVQKRLITRANAAARPVITATQMLESMVEHGQPTRAEVTDVANAVLDGTDAVMLSAETAIGRFPVEAVEMLGRVLRATEAECGVPLARTRMSQPDATSSGGAMSRVACRLALELDAKAIIASVHDVTQALQLSRFRPHAPILAVVDSEDLRRRLTMVWGVVPLLLSAGVAEPAASVALGRPWLFERRLARPGDHVVVVSDSGECQRPGDTLQVRRLVL